MPEGLFCFIPGHKTKLNRAETIEKQIKLHFRIKKTIMRNHLIAIQGAVSSFHDLAAKKYFGEETNALECGSFREVCSKLANNEADYGIIAIENKVAGSILLNYQLIEAFGLSIIGETFLPIQLQLMGNPGTTMESIREIISHPMALGQSQLFLSGLEGITVTEYKDTATSAKLVKKDNSNSLAVIAGPKVGQTFGLEVINENVCDEELNYTRFYILSKGEDVVENPDKASVTIRLSHRVGQLSDVLVILKNEGLNLTKIQSIPIPNDHTQYSFHLDIAFQSRQSLDTALALITKEVTQLRILGIYKGEEISSDSPEPAKQTQQQTQQHVIS